MAQFPNDPLLQIFYGSFLVEIRKDLTRGSTYFERARGMRPDPRARFMIFCRDRERTQKAQGDSMGQGAMDLVAYVEFQNSFSALVRSHRNALRANRRFWRLLVHHEIKFKALSNAFEVMDETEGKARTAAAVQATRAGEGEEQRCLRSLRERPYSKARGSPVCLWRWFLISRPASPSASPAVSSSLPLFKQAIKTYRTVLARYPKSAKILRAYASFLEEVRDDPFAARKFTEEAERLEDCGGEDGGEGDGEGRITVNDKLDAVAVINQHGVLKVVNKRLVKLFGYRRQDELIGKNVRFLSCSSLALQFAAVSCLKRGPQEQLWPARLRRAGASPRAL